MCDGCPNSACKGCERRCSEAASFKDATANAHPSIENPAVEGKQLGFWSILAFACPPLAALGGAFLGGLFFEADALMAETARFVCALTCGLASCAFSARIAHRCFAASPDSHEAQ